MKRPGKKKSKRILKKHPLGNKRFASNPLQQGNIVSPATAGSGNVASVSSTGGGTVTGA